MAYPRIEVTFGGGDSFREPLVVEAADFIAVKGFKAKGKRLTTYSVAEIRELEPLRQEEPVSDEVGEVDDNNLPENGTDNPDENPSGQMTLF